MDAALGGLDIAMPGPPVRPDYFGSMLAEAVKDQQVSEEEVTEKAIRIVYAMASTGVLDDHNNNTADRDVTSPDHVALARELASQSCILLKNEEDILPLDDTVQSIAVIGIAGGPAGAHGRASSRIKRPQSDMGGRTWPM